MAYGYNPYYPMQDQLAQLRNNPMQYQPYQPTMQPMAQQPVMQAQPMQQPMMQQPQPVQAPQPSISGPVYVNGEAGARGYIVAPNQTVMLIDADPDANTFWLKSADAAGMPSMHTYDYTERNATKATPAQTVDYVTHKELDALAARAEDIAAEVEQLKAKKCSCKPAKKEDAE